MTEPTSEQEVERVTFVKLRITWDPAQHDHPAGWDFACLMSVDDAELIDFEDKEP